MSYTLEQADILIDLAQQTLRLPKHNKFYLISSGKNGIGEQETVVKPQEAGIVLPKRSVMTLQNIQSLLRASPQAKFTINSLHNSFHKGTGFYREFYGWMVWRLVLIRGRVVIPLNDISTSMGHLIRNRWAFRCLMAVSE